MSAVTGLRKVTPVIVVERVEAVLPFWAKLGLSPTVEVPDPAATDGRLAFAILAAAGIEVMYQTRASLEADLVEAASDKTAFRGELQQSLLFVEVESLDETERSLLGERVIMPRRTTFYGTVEIGMADPAGNVVVFAEHAAVD